MKLRCLAMLLVAAILPAGCGFASFEECYVAMTLNRREESADHVEHCDLEMKLIHSSALGCLDDHAAHNIRADFLDTHCQSVQ